MSKDRVGLRDFAMGLLAALYIRHTSTLSERDPQKLHASFIAAFKSFEEDVGPENLVFWMNISRGHDTSADVFNILSYWQGPWATKDSPGTIWRFRLNEDTAESLFTRLPVSREIYIRAADAFLERYDN